MENDPKAFIGSVCGVKFAFLPRWFRKVSAASGLYFSKTRLPAVCVNFGGLAVRTNSKLQSWIHRYSKQTNFEVSVLS